MEVPLSFGGTQAGVFSEFQFTVQFTGGELALGSGDTDSDGTTVFANPLDPSFAQLVALLTNGLDDTMGIFAFLGGSSAGSTSPDTHPSIARAVGLAGPDLFGAIVTGIGFQIDSADINSDGSNTTHSVTGTWVVVGFPN